MKVLLIGMDGAHIDVFKRGWTPFISSLIEKGNQLNIKNDLLSRGWLEIATGKHASITGAMYDNPKINKTHKWNLKFSINDIPGLGIDIKPIWQVLNEKGYRVGVMNLPTVFPSPKVDGFFVSGGGGGAPVVEQAIPELCYPKEILNILKKNDYIVDERTVQLVVDKKLDTPDLIMGELANKNSKRTKSFIELANELPPLAELLTAREANEDDLQLQYDTAVRLIADDQIEAALEGLLVMLKKDKSFDDELARKTMIKVFELLGKGDAMATAYRRKMFTFLH